MLLQQETSYQAVWGFSLNVCAFGAILQTISVFDPLFFSF
jgi:hypothetical protein